MVILCGWRVILSKTWTTQWKKGLVRALKRASKIKATIFRGNLFVINFEVIYMKLTLTDVKYILTNSFMQLNLQNVFIFINIFYLKISIKNIKMKHNFFWFVFTYSKNSQFFLKFFRGDTLKKIDIPPAVNPSLPLPRLGCGDAVLDRVRNHNLLLCTIVRVVHNFSQS